MKTHTISVLACTALGACNDSPPAETAPGLAADALGDVVPRELHVRATPPVTQGLAQASIPVAPERVGPVARGTERLTFQGARVRVEPMTTRLELPVDTVADDTWLYLAPTADGEELTDALADLHVTSPTGEPLATGDGAIRLAGHGAGVYQIARARPRGLTVEVTQPASPIALAIEATAAVHFPGDATRVDVALLDGAQPIASARVTAELVSPDGSRTMPLAVQSRGGAYSALVASVLRLGDPTGMYSVYVTAEGTTASGVRFMKSGTVAVKYTIPTARIARVMPMRVVRGTAGIEAFEVDVGIEVAATDRYEVTGLVAASYRGAAHRVCLAQTADVLEPGDRVLTLRCDAGLVKLTGLQGTFHLEQLQLFSQGRAELQHRITKGLSTVRATNIRHAQLIELHERTPAVDEMITQGLFRVD